jgi:TonB family protein
MTTLTLELLPERKNNYPALLTAFAFQSMVVVALSHFAVINPLKIIREARSLVYTPLVEMTEPVVPQTRIRAYDPPVVGKLMVSKPSPAVHIPTAVVGPPKLESQAKTPVLPIVSVLPPKPALQVGAFVPTAEKPTPRSPPAAQVQTGGFGDSNDIRGQGDGKSKLTVATLGSFGMPDGPGYGNGTGGVHGKAATVQSSGFGDESAASRPAATVQDSPQRNTGRSVEIISKPTPQYTEEARQLRLEGEVLLRVQFLTIGEVRVLKVMQGLGHGLDEQAMHAAEKIKFKPAEHDGQRIDSEATIHIIFELAS